MTESRHWQIVSFLGALCSAIIMLGGLTFTQESKNVLSGTPDHPSYMVKKSSSPINIDGTLDEAAWADATVMKILFEYMPGDNIPAPVDTDFLITFDENNLYMAFRSYDPDPSQVRAHLMDRDAMETFIQDDHVTVMIDFFNDERRGFQFRVNPLGVQADANFSVRAFVRAFIQYQDISNNPDLYTYLILPKNNTLFTQFLFSYKVNPQTVLFIGYSDDYLGYTGIDILQKNRTFFMKIGYAWLK
jgi:hypothetical protein